LWLGRRGPLFGLPRRYLPYTPVAYAARPVRGRFAADVSRR